MNKKIFLLFSAIWLLFSCSGAESPTPLEMSQAKVPVSSINAVPLTDMGSSLYLGKYVGGLYMGTNTPPASHTARGVASAQAIEPLDANGNPSSTGKVGMISIGMSNLSQEWCCNATTTSLPPVNSWSFMGQGKNTPHNSFLRVANGAMYSQTNADWQFSTNTDYNIVASRLPKYGLTEKQIQVVVLKVADKQPRTSLPALNADMYSLIGSTADIIRALKIRYPNLRQVYILTRIYAGYAKVYLSPEPYAYEGGFAVQYVVNAGIRQADYGVVDTLTGALPSNVWISWGPYLWANGVVPRSDGLTWVQSEFEADGTHPSTSGETKVASKLLQFFLSEASTCWFRQAGC